MATYKPLTYFVDSPSVRVFLEFAGESLENLNEIDAWDIVAVLSQAIALATLDDCPTIDIPSTILGLSESLELSGEARKALKALHGFPCKQVNALMIGIISVAFDEGPK